MRTRIKKKIEKQRRNTLPDLILVLLVLMFLLFIIYFVNTSTFLAIPVFFVAVFLLVFFASSIFVKDIMASFIISTAFLIFLIFRYFKIGNIVNVLLLVGITITILLYEYNSKKTN